MIRYVTRWACSDGIHKLDGEYTEDGKYFRSPSRVFVPAREAFETLEDAQVDAQARATKKIAALKKQIAKLENNFVPRVKDFTK